ncbi:MAG: M43 family zinc metalloprotease [Phycisphaerales bacterium]|nr:M43 family zinc metalloprotease [Phycisphaerales bacterium]
MSSPTHTGAFRTRSRCAVLVMPMAVVAAMGWSGSAQAAGYCGTVPDRDATAKTQRYLEDGTWAQAREYRWQDSRDGVVQLRVAFHIIRHNDGSGGLYQPDGHIEDLLATANGHLTGAGVELVKYGDTLFIDDDSFYTVVWDWDDNEEVNALRSTDVVDGAINVYMVPDFSWAGGISSYPWASTQGIVMSNYAIPWFGNTTTLSHEVGHYLHLFHTHDTHWYDRDTDPPEGWWGLECTDGSNCGAAGDYLCDTPADPKLDEYPNVNCEWSDLPDDPCGTGVPYAPDETNLMSYAGIDCKSMFSCEQLNVMAWSARNERADHIIGAAPPCIGDIFADCESGTPPDGIVGVLDLSTVLTHWGGEFSPADLDGNGTVDIGDLMLLLTHWGACD